MATETKSLEELLEMQRKIGQEIAQKQAERRNTIREDIEKLLSSAGVQLEDVFADKFKIGPAKKAATGPRTPGTPKYFHDGTEVDGRSARREPVFEDVKTNGKIDDKKARDAGMLNPKWLAEQRPGILKLLGIKSVEDYKKKFSY